MRIISTRLSDSGKSAFTRLNWPLLVFMLLLLAVGFMFIQSATAMRTGEVRFLHMRLLKQWIPLGLLAYIAAARINHTKWNDWSWIIYILAVFALILVLIPGIGTERLGARRWLLGFFQPSEFAKIATIPITAFILGGSNIAGGMKKFCTACAVAAVPMLLIVLEPDLGSAAVLIPTIFAMLFVAGCAPRLLLWGAFATLLLAALFFAAVLVPERLDPEHKAAIEQYTDKVIFPHWKKRIITFAGFDNDPLGAGWNKEQSIIAVGSGGRFGKGYGKGTQNILGFLPRAVSSTDFIFSVIAEEMGYRGSVILLLLYAGLLVSIGWTAFACRDEQGRLICIGVFALLFTHIFVNIAMTIGLMPITGIPLPLVSYGGTFTIAIMASLGLVQGVWIHGREVKN